MIHKRELQIEKHGYTLSTYLLYSRVSDIVLLIGAVGFGFMMQNFRTEVLSKEQRKLVGRSYIRYLEPFGGISRHDRRSCPLCYCPGLFPPTQYISAPVAMLVMFGMIPLIGGVFGYFFRKRCTREGKGGHEVFWGIRRSKRKPRRYGRTSIRWDYSPFVYSPCGQVVDTRNIFEKNISETETIENWGKKMQVTFRLFSFLKAKVDKKRIICDVPENVTIKQALDILFEKTALSSRDLLEDGTLRSEFIVLTNGKSSTNLSSEKLTDGDKISLMPTIGGGKRNELTERDLERYKRQIILNGLGKDGQATLKSTKVAVVGVGGLGSPIAIYLTAAGFGEITLIDSDEVEFNNLNRQILHWERDIGSTKVRSAKEKLEQLNSDVSLNGKTTILNEENVEDLLRDVDLVIDGMDNFKTRFLVNRYCVEQEIPFIHAAVYGLEGRLTTIIPNEGPCLRCLMPETPAERKNFPILGANAGVIATLEVMEAVKVTCNIGKPLTHRLLIFNGTELRFHTVEIKKNPKCLVCGDKD